MSKLLYFLKSRAILGKEPQNFLGAAWVNSLLKKIPKTGKRLWALRILSLSPHYFFQNAGYKKLSYNQFLEAEFQRNQESRTKIYNYILEKHFNKNFVVMDYGCGPGFLARVVAPDVKKVYACDISTGVLACAGIINSAPNIEYILANEQGLKAIPSGTIDIIYSIAVIQHVTDNVLEMILDTCNDKLKPGGKLIVQVQLDVSSWRSEKEWQSDKSIQGKIKYKYGLNCFSRKEDSLRQIFTRHSFVNISVESIADMVNEDFDDICTKHLLIAYKNRI